jgi:hypothetical protein
LGKASSETIITETKEAGRFGVSIYRSCQEPLEATITGLRVTLSAPCKTTAWQPEFSAKQFSANPSNFID